MNFQLWTLDFGLWTLISALLALTRIPCRSELPTWTQEKANTHRWVVL